MPISINGIQSILRIVANICLDFEFILITFPFDNAAIVKPYISDNELLPRYPLGEQAAFDKLVGHHNEILFIGKIYQIKRLVDVFHIVQKFGNSERHPSPKNPRTLPTTRSVFVSICFAISL